MSKTFQQLEPVITELNKRLFYTEDTLCYGKDLFAAAIGGDVTTYPTRVKIPDKTEISMATSISFNSLPANEFGSDYMVSFTVYDTDKTTVVTSSDGWKMRNMLTNIDVEKGQYLSLTVRFYPNEVDTSSDSAVKTIASAVRFRLTDAANQIVVLGSVDAAHTSEIATIGKDAYSGYNAYFSFYVATNGRWKNINRANIVAKDGTIFDSTPMFIRPSNNLIVVRSASPYGNANTVSKTWEQVCKEIGDRRVAEIDGEDYVALLANESFCFNIETSEYAVLGATVSKHKHVVLLQQKSQQLNGGYILPKVLYDDVSVKIENANLAVNNVASAVNKITANEYEFPVADIIANRDLQNDKTLMFLWASDTHHQIHGTATYGVKTKKIAEMSQVAKQAGVDFVCVTGDVVNGYYPIAEQKSCLVNFVKTLRKYYDRPAFIVEGNHDDNSWYASASGGSSGTEYTGLAQTLQTEAFTNYAMTNQFDSVQFDEDNPLGGYYYYDFRKSKIRCICLNCEDIPYIENADKSLKYYGQWTMAYSEKQLKWLAEKALVFAESGWGVLFFQHNDKQMSGNTQNVINLSLLTQIVDGYRNKTSGTAVSTQADFEANVPYNFGTNKSNEVCAWFAGHTHKDEHELIDGVPHVSIINTFNQTGGGYDLVTVDRKNRKIVTKRYNGGALTAYDREISY